MFKLEEIVVKEISRDDAVTMFGEAAVSIYEKAIEEGRTPKPLKIVAEKTKTKTKTITVKTK